MRSNEVKEGTLPTIVFPRWGLCSLLATSIPIGCSAGEAPDMDGTGGALQQEEAEPLPPAPAPETSMGGLGGTSGEGTHPLFGAGNYSGVDESDVCNTAQIWKVDSAMELETGTLVLYEGTIWELTGTANEEWALESCTPPGTGWCAEQYAWEEVETCE